MKIWLIGRSGILGSSLFSYLERKKIDFIPTATKDVDITKKEQIEIFLQKNAFSHVINCAAYTSVDDAERNASLCYEINARGVENLSISCSEKNIKLVSFSTDYVFSGESLAPYKEEDLISPINVYGKSKAEGERLLFKRAKDFLLIRTSWLFGNGKNFITTMLGQMQKKEEIKVVSDQIGRPTSADDLAEAAYLLLSENGVFHFANDTALSWHQYALKIFEIAKSYGFKLKCKNIAPISSLDFPTPAKRPGYSILDTQKVEDLLKKPTPSLDRALIRYFKTLCKEM